MNRIDAVSYMQERGEDYKEELINSLPENSIGTDEEWEEATNALANAMEAQLDKVPYMVIVGQKEVDDSNISVRKRDAGDMGSICIQQFADSLKKEMEE